MYSCCRDEKRPSYISCDNIDCTIKQPVCQHHLSKAKYCKHCNTWKDVSCYQHRVKCGLYWCGRSSIEYEQHIVKKRLMCDACSISYSVTVCCRHELDMLLISQSLFKRCKICGWILCLADRFECKGCHSYSCLDHCKNQTYCTDCLISIKVYLIQTFPLNLDIVELIINF